MIRIARIRSRREPPNPRWYPPLMLIFACLSYVGLVVAVTSKFHSENLLNAVILPSFIGTPLFTYLYHRASITRLLEEISEELSKINKS